MYIQEVLGILVILGNPGNKRSDIKIHLKPLFLRNFCGQIVFSVPVRLCYQEVPLALCLL